MGNAVNIFDIAGEDLATFLAKPISDGSYSDIVVTTKVDYVTLTSAATQIDTNAGKLWGNLVDDYIRASYPILRSIAAGPFLLAGAEAGDAPVGADELVIGDGSGAFGATIFTSNATAGTLAFTDTAGASQGSIAYDHATDQLDFTAGSTTVAAVAATGLHPSATATYDLGLTGTRWRSAYLSASVVVPVLTGGDFGTGTGAGVAATVRGGNGGTTGGVGAVLTVQGGDAQANNDAGGVLALRSGNSDGTADAPNVTLASGTSGSGALGVVRITNTCLEIAESATTPGATIAAGAGRFWVRDDAPSRPAFTDDAGSEFGLLLHAPQNGALAQSQTLASGAASTVKTFIGVGYPTASGQITAADFVDYLGANVGSAPTINGYTFGTIAGAGALLSLQTFAVDLDSTATTIGDRWALVVQTETNGLIILTLLEIT